MTPISEAVKQIVANPAVVIAIDSCSLLDLFQLEKNEKKCRPSVEDIRAVAEFLDRLSFSPNIAHLIVPELVPREFEDNADRVEKKSKDWFEFHDEKQLWLAESSKWLGFSPPTPLEVGPQDIPLLCRKLAERLLGQAAVLDRDQVCLDRAVQRLVSKTRPSHKNQMKDSMNLEQVLELSRQLLNCGFTHARVFISSNINDFAENSKLHPDLRQDFVTAGLEYFTSFPAAFGRLRSRGQLP